MPQDLVTLTVPARSEFAKTVRLTAASLSNRVGMTYDEVDDVRMAAEEAFIYAVETLPAEAEVRFEFTMTEDAITIDVALGQSSPEVDDAADRSTTYATFIMESVCDSCQFVSDESGAHLRLTKRAGSVDAD